jgi:CRISPR-associated endoribonuclease Cas6
MFLHLIQQVDPALSQRLHDKPGYRPYTLSPLGIEQPIPKGNFQGYWLPRDHMLQAEMLCSVRITFLDDDLFPTFSSYFLSRIDPTFRLGETEFVVTDVLTGAEGENTWACYLTYSKLIEQASRDTRQIRLRFLTPTSFGRGRVDFPLPDPRLVFRSYMKRFTEFCQVAFPSDFEEQLEYHTGISNLKSVQTRIIKTKEVPLLGFTGTVTFVIHNNAPPELVFGMNLLADYAFFCGTGKKTAIGMGQTMRVGEKKIRRSEGKKVRR